MISNKKIAMNFTLWSLSTRVVTFFFFYKNYNKLSFFRVSALYIVFNRVAIWDEKKSFILLYWPNSVSDKYPSRIPSKIKYCLSNIFYTFFRFVQLFFTDIKLISTKNFEVIKLSLYLYLWIFLDITYA